MVPRLIQAYQMISITVTSSLNFTKSLWRNFGDGGGGGGSGGGAISTSLFRRTSRPGSETGLPPK